MSGEARTALKKRSFAVARRLRVRVVEGPDAGAVVEPEGRSVITVGCEHGCDVTLTDPAVSRFHVELTKGDDGIGLADLGSRNGTFIGGVRVAQGVLPVGARIELGSSALIVEDGARSVSPPAGPVDVPGIVGASDATARIRRQVATLARVQTSVLVEGETGVGKEVVARALHEAGPRRAQPFVVIDCGSLPATLIAAQLFGHERGAFTGATETSPGAFERAGGGTVLLDEIGEMPLDLQPALLGVLERRRVVRVGGSSEIAVEARVLAATNRDLRAQVNAGAFRADLYHRLAVARLVIPPLRERRDDIAPLVEHFCELLTGEPGVPEDLQVVLSALVDHPLTGNARELRNIVEGALVMGGTPALSSAGEPGAGPAPTVPYRDARADALHRFERTYLSALIKGCDGNASEAARRARMDRPYLLTLLRRHGLR